MKKTIFLFLVLCLLPGLAEAEKTLYSLDLMASTEYTDNLYLTKNDKEDDWTSLFGGTFSASRSSRISELSFRYAFERSQYWRYTENNTNRHTLNLGYLRHLAKHVSFNVTNTYYRSEEPIERNPDVFRERKGKRDPYYRYTGAVSLAYEFDPKSNLQLGASLNYLQNEDPDTEDSRIYQQFIRLRKGFTRYFVSLGLEFTEREFETSPQVNTWGVRYAVGHQIAHNKEVSLNFSSERTQEMGPGGEDYWTHRGDISYTYSPTPDQTYGASLGFYYRKVDGSSDKDKGLTYSLSYSKSFRHTTLSLSGSGGYRYEYGEAENTGFTEYYLIQAAVSRQFTRTLTGFANGSFRVEDFKQQEDRTDKTYTASLGLSKQLLKRVHFSIVYSYRKADSDLDRESYTENRVVAKITCNLWQRKSLW